MTDARQVSRPPAPSFVRGADVAAKAGLLILLAMTLVYPELGHVRGKAAGLRSIGYPVVAFTVPVLWSIFWRKRAPFPWAADLLLTIPCFTDTLGNRMNLYDSVVWFDDWMHFMNTALLTAGILLLTMSQTSSLGATIERALAFGMSAALFWELAEYFAFISDSSERHSAYPDTLGDLSLGAIGSIAAALLTYAYWQAQKSDDDGPQLEPDLEPLDPLSP